MKKRSKRSRNRNKRRQKAPRSSWIVQLDETVYDPHEWLWCSYCFRFFQVKDFEIDFIGNRQACPFCEAAGLDGAIFLWDTFKSGETWPASADELSPGFRLPGDRLIRLVNTPKQHALCYVTEDADGEIRYRVEHIAGYASVALSAEEVRAAREKDFEAIDARGQELAANPRWLVPAKAPDEELLDTLPLSPGDLDPRPIQGLLSTRNILPLTRLTEEVGMPLIEEAIAMAIERHGLAVHYYSANGIGQVTLIATASRLQRRSAARFLDQLIRRAAVETWIGRSVSRAAAAG